MSPLTIKLNPRHGGVDDAADSDGASGSGYRPGDELRGTAAWALDAEARALELRLCWFTEGRGDRDVSIVETVRFDNPGPREEREFRFTLPPAPYSFSGSLITLHWALELIALPGNENTQQRFTMSPTGEALRLAAST